MIDSVASQPLAGRLSPRTRNLIVAVPLLLAFGLLVARTAWLSDDAYITFRTIQSLSADHGPNWNPDERVQAFTHPLWAAVLTVGYFLTKELPLTTVVISVSLSVISVGLMGIFLSRSVWSIVFIFSAFAFSRAFLDYSTSGLENPLSHFLMAGFLCIFLRFQNSSKLMRLAGGIAGLGLLNRLDVGLIYAPAVLSAVRGTGSRTIARDALTALAPLTIWEAFSMAYYGFPFPNTAYAKLNTGIPIDELARQGLRYIANLASFDLLSLLLIGAGVTAGILSRRRELAGLAIGVLFYLGYLIVIGGDFMAGRLFSLPLMVSVAVLLRSLPNKQVTNYASIVVCVAVGLVSPNPGPLTGREFGQDQVDSEDAWGISDERAIYYPYTGLLSTEGLYDELRHPWMLEGIRIRDSGVRVVQGRAIGFLGFYAGPRVHIVDQFALADPLLARLPANIDPDWRIGHFDRAIPEGYLESLQSGSNLIESKSLRAFYDELSLIIRGPLWSSERWAAIWRMNSGANDDLIYSYRVSRYASVSLNEVQPGNEVGGESLAEIWGGEDGIRIRLGQLRTNRHLDICLRGASEIAVLIEREGRVLKRHFYGSTDGQVVDCLQIPIPWVNRIRGYDTIVILPVSSEGFWLREISLYD